MNKNLKLAIAAAALITAIPIAIWIWTLISWQGTAKVELIVLPVDAKVTVNDEDFSNKKSIRLKPGDYTFTVSKDGFETDTQKLKINNSDKNVEFFSTPIPVSNEALLWAEENLNSYHKLEGRAGKASAEKGRELIEKHPIVSILPIQEAVFSIGYKTSGDNESLTLTVHAEEGYRESALQKIRDQGYDPSDYKIVFEDYRSPFNE